jgi:hypothetical protein
MENLLKENEILEEKDPALYDEDGYLIASLEEGLADERAGRVISYKSREDRMKYLFQETDDDV